MKAPLEKNDSYLIAKEKVQKIKRFYLHLILYIIVVVLLICDFLILEENNKFADLFILFNSIVVILWAILISLHAWIVFKGRLFFKKSWEERKLKEYMGKEETKWE